MIRVLVVDGDPATGAALEASLSASRVARFELELASRLEDAVERVRTDDIDVVLLDLDLPDAHGLASVVRLRAEAPSVPTVVHTGVDDEVLARAAVNIGAQDYIVKGTQDASALARTLRYAVDRQGIVDELNRARAELAESLEETRRAYQSERRTAIRLQELDQLKNDFVGIASHDLRAPLAVISGYTNMLLDERRDLDAQQRAEFLRVILRNTEDMRLLIADILDVSAIDSGSLSLDLATFDLVDVVRTSAAELAVGANRTCVVHAPARARPVLGDPRRHRQILANLVTNSFKFAPDDTPVEITVTPRAEVLEVQVRDHGIGIADTDVDKLFRRFSPVRANGAGTGLGLYITKCLVDAQGGTIAVDGRPGDGTTFTYTAPFAA